MFRIAKYEDKINEADVVYSQIEEYEDNKAYYLYLSSISIDKRYRNNYRVITNLLKGCINILDLLFKRNIKIEKIMADASTIHGEKICKKLLKMDYIRDTNHESKIYCEDEETFVKAIELIRNLKYNQVRRVFTLYEVNFDNTKNIKLNENIFNYSIKIAI